MTTINRMIFAGIAAAGKMRAPAIAICLLTVPFLGLNAYATPVLGTARDFAVLGASTVTNTGPTTITGDVGLTPPGVSITGFAVPPANTVVNGPGSTGLVNGPGLVIGTIRIRDGVAVQAQSDTTTAYNNLAALGITSDLTGAILGNGVGGTVPTLSPGVYRFSSTAQLNGTLTLNAQNNPNALFLFQIGTALTTASASSVQVTNGGANVGVFWLLGTEGPAGTGSATLGTTTAFAGNILARESITLTTGANILCGRALALNGAVTLDTNTISNNCADTLDFGSNSFSSPAGLNGNGTGGTGGGAVPEPSTVVLLGSGLVGLVAWKRRRSI